MKKARRRMAVTTTTGTTTAAAIQACEELDVCMGATAASEEDVGAVLALESIVEASTVIEEVCDGISALEEPVHGVAEANAEVVTGVSDAPESKSKLELDAASVEKAKAALEVVVIMSGNPSSLDDELGRALKKPRPVVVSTGPTPKFSVRVGDGVPNIAPN